MNCFIKYVCGIYAVLLLGLTLHCKGQVSTRDYFEQAYTYRARWLNDIEKISKAAMRYRYQSKAGGSEMASYTGFTIPEDCDSSEYGTYSLYETFPKKIVIQANLIFNKSPIIIIIDSLGNYNDRRWGLDYEVDKIGELAYQYRIRPASEGGGQQSYVGFKIPIRYASTAFGRYTISQINKELLTIHGKSCTEKLDGYSAFNGSGKRRSLGDSYYDVMKISELACQYRTHPVSQGGGQGSYIGFKIPYDFTSTSRGKFWLHDVQPDELVMMEQPIGYSVNYILVFDSLGKQKYGGYEQYGDAKPFNTHVRAIIEDIRLISKEAARYWRRTKPSPSLQGSFDGFAIPDTLTNTANGLYSIAEVRDDILFICAVSSKGCGTEYFQIDAQGNQHRLAFGEYRLPKVQPKRNIAGDAQAMYRHADVHLNEIYQQLLRKRKADNRFIKNLLAAERLWIKYRDAQLTEKYPKLKPASDKSMFTKPQLIYLTILTENRIKELQEMFDQP